MGDTREFLRAVHAEIWRAAREAVRPFTRGGKLDLSTPNSVGRVPVARGGTGNDQGAGPHALVGDLHTASGLTAGQVLTALSGTTFGFAAIPEPTTVWQPLANGDAAAPELVFADGDVIMVPMAG